MSRRCYLNMVSLKAIKAKDQKREEVSSYEPIVNVLLSGEALEKFIIISSNLNKGEKETLIALL